MEEKNQETKAEKETNQIEEEEESKNLNKK